jgi:hypothetical protein
MTAGSEDSVAGGGPEHWPQPAIRGPSTRLGSFTTRQRPRQRAAARRHPEFARGSGSATVLNAHPTWRIRWIGRAPHADVAQLVEHHLAKVRVAGSNPVVRSEAPDSVPQAQARTVLRMSKAMIPQQGTLALAEWPSGLGKGLQSPVRGFDSRLRLEGDWRSGSAPR